MERLDFRLPEFTRCVWVSDAARSAWESRIASVVRGWRELEWLTVACGVRDAGLLATADSELDLLARRVAKAGLALAPVDRIAAPGAYASARSEPEPGGPSLLRIMVGRAAVVDAFRAAWRTGDQLAVGRLLGYPSCCTTFFKTAWVEGRYVDTTWPMATNTTDARREGRACEVVGSSLANVLLRWLGVRAVPHLPCSFDCDGSRQLGEAFVATARAHGYGPEADDLLHMLEWPVEWSALHGIAEIKTPVVKISATTDATGAKYVVRRVGASYPEAGARGLAFPYQQPPRRRVSESRTFYLGLAKAGECRRAHHDADWYYHDNGFPTRAAMDAAHVPIVDLARTLLPESGGAVLDLGCGNGALLEKIARARRGVLPYGIDTDERKIGRARAMLANAAGNFLVGSFFDCEELWQGSYCLALLMPGRLVEADSDTAARLRERLAEHVSQLLLYVYPGYANPHGDLAGLARAAGLDLAGQVSGSVGVASLVRPAARKADVEILPIV
jgi:2-polyprenyl-3-methyl-5-hydroxy-6-metoxy-1,4-benzoquinol methylase